MNCREFKSQHVGFVDDLLSATNMAECHRHIQTCEKCAALDTRVRRSLLVVRNLPDIEPSADFMSRLNEALKQPPVERQNRNTTLLASGVAAVAAIAAGLYLALVFQHRALRVEPAGPSVFITTTLSAPPVERTVIPTAAMAAVPAGVPIWPAMFMVGELPAQMTSADLLDPAISR